jgi:hypothetical protein
MLQFVISSTNFFTFGAKIMTYLELAKRILFEMTEEQRNCDVTLVDVEFSEAFPAILSFVEEDQENFGLDNNQPFLYPSS